MKSEEGTALRPQSSQMELAGSLGSSSMSTSSGGRYVLYGEIASGGMASVQYGKLLGPHGFARPVAIKRLHPHIAKEPEFLSMFIDEARLSARLVHANIIHTLDVIQAPGELALVMEYVHGESLWTLLRLAREQGHEVPLPVASALLASTLHGLHAAHEARGDDGEPLQIVHRDVSPPNILIGSDGIPRVLDFGIAKALGRMHATPSGEIKGKLGYIAPEQLHATHVDRRTDVYGAAAVLWEALTGARLFDGPTEPAIVHRVLYGTIDAPSVHRPEVPPALDAIVRKGLSRNMAERFTSAQEMALALEHSTRLASQSEIAAWLEQLAGTQLATRARSLSEMQNSGDPSGAGAQPGAAQGTRRIQAATTNTTDNDRTIVIASDDPMLRQHRMRGWVIGAAVAALAITLAAWAANAAPRSRWWKNTPVLHSTTTPPTETRSSSAAAPPTAATQTPKAQVQVEIPVESPPRAAAPETHDHTKPSQRRSSMRSPAPAPLAPVAPAIQSTSHAAFVASERSSAAIRGATSARATPPKEPSSSSTTNAASPAHQADPCVPFYRVDERSIRRPKPECF